MDDLVKFLRARLDEERTEAEKQPDGEEAMLDGWEIIATAESNYPCYEYLRIAKRRVLADVEAKRRIVARVEHHASLMGRDEIHDDLLRLLALPYADHPDYREDWRP